MKTILVATDFSEASLNAGVYAVKLARQLKSNVLLFHSYHFPVSVAPAPEILNFDELEESNLRKLENMKHVLDPSGDLGITCIVSAGFADDRIVELEKQYKPDLIVMGMAKAGKVSEWLLGSVSTSLIPRIATPLLIVPETAQFNLPKKIVFACDYDLDPVADSLKPLKEFAHDFNSHVLILNLFKKKDLSNSEKTISEMIVENYLKDIEHSYYFQEDGSFVQSINIFAETQKADMVTIIPHHSNFFQSLFRKGHTKKLAFGTHLPLFVIPGKA
jgi:nucleotide-binding universal stress UspA family protein